MDVDMGVSTQGEDTDLRGESLRFFCVEDIDGCGFVRPRGSY